MGRMLVLLVATVAVWGSVGWVWTDMTAPDNGAYFILGVFAFLSTAVIWAIGGNITLAQSRQAAHSQHIDYSAPKAKRSSSSLASVVDTLTPKQIAALEIALERRRDSFDEDDQILANRLSAELERGAQT